MKTRYKITIEGREIKPETLGMLDKGMQEEAMKFESPRSIAYSWYYKSYRDAIDALQYLCNEGFTYAYLMIVQEIHQ